MSFWSVLLIIAAIGAIYSLKRHRNESRGGYGDGNWGDRQAGSSAREIALEREVEELRERVKVLERIATDSNSGPGRDARAIAQEIESLRDK